MDGGFHNIGCCQQLVDLGVEGADHGRGRTGRGEDAIPGADIKALETGFGHRGHIRSEELRLADVTASGRS